MVRIVVIGVGGIGFRHFQSILTLNRAAEIYLVDTSQAALDKARDMAEAGEDSSLDIFYLPDVECLPDSIDIAIIATSSLVRGQVFKKLIAGTEVKYVIFEKFLFPSIGEYEEIGKILHDNSVRAYVNCPCRLYPGYKELKPGLTGEEKLHVFLKGSLWGLTCNAIHYIDVIGYLMDSYENIICNGELLDQEIQNSKRTGYVEYTGQLFITMGNKADIVMESYSTGETGPVISIYTKNDLYMISEIEQKLIIYKNGQVEQKPFPIYYQSQLTASVVEEILDTGTCGLTSYENTVNWHKELLETFLAHYNKVKGTDAIVCPIT